MSYKIEKNGDVYDIVINGWEKGISASPHKGIANMQAVNTSTENGEVMCSYNRTKQSQTPITSGTLTQTSTNTVSVSGGTLLAGSWITVTSAGIAGLSNGSHYYYLGSGKLSATFAQDASTVITGLGSGSCTFTTYKDMGNPVQSATEIYTDTNGVAQYRYYVLDANGYIWVHDSATLSGVDTPLWFLPDTASGISNTLSSGLAVYNGWLTFTSDNFVYWKPTTNLGATFVANSSIGLITKKFHATLWGHQGSIYWTDGNFIAKLFANSSLITGAANIQSNGIYTASSTTGTVSTLISGSYPTLVNNAATTRIPAIFYTAGTKPTALTADVLSPLGGLVYTKIYYIKWLGSSTTFEVYAAASGGSALDIQTGAVGTQYFNTFCPITSEGANAFTFTGQKLNLPTFETAQCMVELGNNVLVGGSSGTLYPWNQVSPLPQDEIQLPESNIVNMINVSNIAYIFGGSKGNIYVSNGSGVSLAIKVPDYCAGIAGTPASYIEPYFTWGGASFFRGRVYFSILDQTASKTGNCGGIWSFIPTQNASPSQDEGMCLRVENQNSYGTYNGVATVILPNRTQTANGPQYWSAWYSDVTSPTYGIDYSDTITTPSAVIESDLIPTATLLNKQTFSQIEYKLSSPLASGETVTMSYRLNGTDSYTSLGTVVTESATSLSGYFPANFEKSQWLQIKTTLNPLASSSSSFCRLKEVRVR